MSGMQIDREHKDVSSNLDTNTKLFRFGGVIGRKNYIINSVIIMVYPIFLYIIYLSFGFLAAFNTEKTPLVLGIGFLLLLPCFSFIPVGLSLLSRRIRDIRGTNKDHWLWVGGYLVLGFIPLLNFMVVVAWIFLIFWPGKITNPIETRRFKTALSDAFDSTRLVAKDPTEQLKDLERLKHQGAISQTEFDQLKADILKKTVS